MIDETYFFDSYAIFEMLEGNLNYEKYKSIVKDQNFSSKNFVFSEYSQGAPRGDFSVLDYSLTILTKLNLFEIYYGILKEKGK